MEEKVDKLLSLVTITSSLQLDDLTYTEGKISHQNDPAAATFGRDVKKAYQAHGSRRDLCWCLLRNAELPASSVIGAHLFKWHWHERMHVLGLSDINDMGNGLPLWKPIEWAYDTSRLCFVYDKSRDELVAHVLDNSILGIGSKRARTHGSSLARTRPLSSQSSHISGCAYAPIGICTWLLAEAHQAHPEFPCAAGEEICHFAWLEPSLARSIMEL